MKIFVTGASGFVGQHLVRYLTHAGHEVDTRRFDITTPFTVTEKFDVVIHLAAYNITNVGDTDLSIYVRVNIEGTKHVLSGVQAQKYIFLSTTKFYRKGTEIIREESEIDPQNPYEQSKWQAEQECLKLKTSKELVILRGTNVFGPGQPEKAVIPIFLGKAIHNEPIKVFGPRGAWLQFLYIDDLIQAILKVATTPKINGVFNLASPELVRLEDLASMIKKICHSSSEICLTDEGLPPKVEVSCDKIKKATGWQPLVSLEEGLRRYYQYYAQQHSS